MQMSANVRGTVANCSIVTYPNPGFSGDGKKTVVGTRDAESLAEELRFLRKVASDLRTEKRQLGCKIKSLEEDMKRKDKRFQELLEVNVNI